MTAQGQEPERDWTPPTILVPVEKFSPQLVTGAGGREVVVLLVVVAGGLLVVVTLPPPPPEETPSEQQTVKSKLSNPHGA